jgi:membrane protein YqaA with SNARE-associated domain
MDVLWLSLATLAVSAAGGLIPLINVEAWVIGVSAVGPPAALVPVVLAATVGQVSAKVVLYRAGGGARAWQSRHEGSRLTALVQRLEGPASRGTAVVFSSALTGVPPFYLVSLAAGALRYRFPRFVVLALVGRLLRFALVFLLPQVLVALGRG